VARRLCDVVGHLVENGSSPFYLKLMERIHLPFGCGQASGYIVKVFHIAKRYMTWELYKS
jgi:hypothetical protein